MPKKTIPNNIVKPCYAMAFASDNTAEITMYGEIVETQPYDWWTGEKVEGEFIIQDEFIKDLDAVSGCSKITLRINSVGGDLMVGLLIHNRLRELISKGVNIECVVDGVAMSAGSVIMCACDTVKVHPTSLVMVHKCWMSLWGGYNADDLRELASSCDAWDKTLIAAYNRKTGLSDTVISHMLSETTYLTGKEAITKGFADELVENEADPVIAASADKTTLFVNGRSMRLAKGMKMPDNIPITTSAKGDVIDKNIPTANEEEGGFPTMAKNLEELRAENAELAAQVESEIKASLKAEQDTAVADAVAAERKRIADIDSIAALYDDTIVTEAKYGDNTCTAAEMAYRAALTQAKTGAKFMADAQDDFEESGAKDVTATPEDPEADEPKTDKEKYAAARQAIKAALGKEK